MSGRSGLFLACVLGLGCTPAADAPVPAPPPTHPQVVLDEAGAPAEANPEAPTSSPVAAAPERLPRQINERYAEKTNPKHWAKQFEREGREAYDRRHEILHALALHAGQSVADVGAGTGMITMELARAVGEQGKVYAVDVQAYFLDHIAQKAREQKLGNIEVVKARQDSVQLPPASVDLVLMCDAYHHVEQPAAYLESLLAAIKPGGRLAVIDYRAVEGQSKAWVLEHVRASPQQFRAEIEGGGFRFLREHEDLLLDNFFFEFERP